VSEETSEHTSFSRSTKFESASTAELKLNSEFATATLLSGGFIGGDNAGGRA